jgi:hypothetical protein
LKNNAKLLPDAYKQDGNHKHVLDLNEQARDEFIQAMNEVLDSLDLETASGSTLDMYGEIVNQKRGGLSDKAFRAMIKYKIAKYLSQGDYNTIMSLMKFLLNSEDGGFVMTDAGNASVAITKLPLTTMIDAGFTSHQVIQLIEEFLPAGVGINRLNFEGTFAFSSSDECEKTKKLMSLEASEMLNRQKVSEAL